MKLLIVSNLPSTGNIVKNALQQAAVEGLTVCAVEDAKGIAAEMGPECLALVDWEADPAADAALVRAIKEHAEGKNTPVLLLSTKAKAGTTFAGMKAGADGVVTKPIDATELLSSIKGAIKRIKSKVAPKINVEFINPFIEATKTVLETMAGTSCERKRLFLKDDFRMLGDISGIMGLSGEAVGSIVISFPKDLACRIVSAMLGGEPMGTELSADVCDGVGEIVNMVAGHAKSALAKTKYHFQISIPTVVSGEKHELTHKSGTPNIVVLFETNNKEQFALQVALTPKDE
mgnify:CR=1 FL=1